jgi:pimeloyl-ACP methyl ester carboxylesterase
VRNECATIFIERIDSGAGMRKVFWVLACVIAAPVCGAIYQKVGEWTDRRRHMRGGRLVPVANGGFYLCDMGTECDRGPTVLFESGIGATSQNWLKVQREVATQMRAISYDRAGLGWSTATVSNATPQALARELRALMDAAGIPGPYLVVGHSYGGLVARRFAADYPDLVIGLVLVDPMRPEDWPPVTEVRRKRLDQAIRLVRVGRIAARIGAARLFMRSVLLGSGRIARTLCRPGGDDVKMVMERMQCEAGKMPREAWPSVVANWARPRFYQTMEAYLMAVPETVASAHSAPPLDIAVTVLTPISATALSDAGLSAISRKARQIIAARSEHWVHLDEPELVLAAIREMIRSQRPDLQDSSGRADLGQNAARALPVMH